MTPAAMTSVTAGDAFAQPTMRRTTMTTAKRRRHARPDQSYFLGEFLGAINKPAFWTYATRSVSWRDGGFVNHVQVSSWLGDVPGLPRMTRIAVNDVALVPTREALRVMRFRATDRPTPRPGLAFEITVLDRELYPLAPWLVECIEGRIDPARMIEPPPIDTDLVTEEDLHAAGCAWSVAAWKAHRAWRSRAAAEEAVRRARWQDWLLHGSGAKAASTVPDTTATEATR